jgi:nitrate reductase (cytochrome), electron transfer subunit
MTLHHSFAGFMLMAASYAAFAAQPISADSMGLSKTSVFDVPDPKAYHYNGAQPGENKVLPRGYPGAPPQIPHDVSEFMPITVQSNMCIACHAQPELWGKPREKGTPTPIPQSHYTDLRNAPGKVTDHLINARYNCNQCHVPQADAPALVQNTFGPKR